MNRKICRLTAVLFCGSFLYLLFVTTITADAQTPADGEPSEDLMAADDPPIIGVRPVLFVPNNLTPDPAYLTAIDDAMEEIKNWYASQLGQITFDYVPAIRVNGQHELRYYCPKTITDTQCIQVPGVLGADPGDIYSVLNDLNSQGYPVEDGAILYVFWVGGYGYAGAVQSSPTMGWAALADWALDGIAGKYEAGTTTSNCDDSPSASVLCTKNTQMGAVGHELGHTFGLPHPTDDGTQPGDPNYWLSTIMSAYWNYPNVVLINSRANPEKIKLYRSPFFSSEKLFLPVAHR